MMSMQDIFAVCIASFAGGCLLGGAFMVKLMTDSHRKAGDNIIRQEDREKARREKGL